MCAWVYVFDIMHIGAHEGQEMVSGALELEFQAIAATRGAFCKGSKYFYCWASSSARPPV